MKKWNDVLIASTEGSQCSQVDLKTETKEVEGSEDCLYLNIYTPEVSARNLYLLIHLIM